MAEEIKKEVRVTVRMPQILKDKIVAEAKLKGMNQAELIRYVMTSYFENKEL